MDTFDIDRYFTLIKELTLVVPENYDHKTQLARFEEKYKKNFYKYDERITDEIFSRVIDELIPGKKYTVKLYEERNSYDQTVTIDDHWLRAHEILGGLFVGPQGLSVVFETLRDELPKGKAYISFDQKEKNKFYKESDGFLRSSYLGVSFNSEFGFYLGPLDKTTLQVLLLICPDLQEEKQEKNIPFLGMQEKDFEGVFKEKEEGSRGEGDDLLIVGSTLRGVNLLT